MATKTLRSNEVIFCSLTASYNSTRWVTELTTELTNTVLVKIGSTADLIAIRFN